MAPHRPNRSRARRSASEQTSAAWWASSGFGHKCGTVSASSLFTESTPHNLSDGSCKMKKPTSIFKLLSFALLNGSFRWRHLIKSMASPSTQMPWGKNMLDSPVGTYMFSELFMLLVGQRQMSRYTGTSYTSTPHSMTHFMLWLKEKRAADFRIQTSGLSYFKNLFIDQLSLLNFLTKARHCAGADTSKVAACPDKSNGIATEVMPAPTWHGLKPKKHKKSRNQTHDVRPGAPRPHPTH